MGMDFGLSTIINQLKAEKDIKDTTQWIKNQDMGFINGKMVGFTKEILKTITEMAMESYLIIVEVYIEAIGKMGNK